ncbi:MAG: patatin-like phospholipase family protein [Bacteroidales bacterium]|nr:patatin-like phospholipase family protein [Bacteroidales bacterium]MDY6377778.1 patatin-like phospholipase family protein [Bacteroidales bacterium]MEE3389878.1 patatin-like phospholipase family protein [Candidatus Cryptobacteroides sp.]MEE3429430.1 patatin-like phospholipase family protein [Candidatus Cryptobacteroides sp.]
MKARFMNILLSVFVSLNAICSVSAQNADGDARLKESVIGDLRLEDIRQHLDSVRQNRHRPTVALVLCGGGAKGAAEIGAMQYMKNVGIPVDLVLGTSIGGLIGGIYSLGYSEDQLDALIRSLDWNYTLSDKIPQEYSSYAQRKYREKYILSFPFYYDSTPYGLKIEDNSRIERKSLNKIRLGAGNSDASSMVKNNLLGSLPSGMIYGQNVNNIFSALSVGYQDSIDFYKLPIPFICVATDLVSGKAKVWNEGKLNIALRSTMSIPGMFTPVKTDGMVLVDGGMRNNYPTDIAKAAGADIIIGIDLSEGFKGYDQINNLMDIFGAGIDMMGRNSFENNVMISDVTIKPDLEGYNMLSFDAQSIDTMYQRGYQAALAAADKLDSLKAVIGPDTMTLGRKRAEDIINKKVMVDGVEIIGVTEAESAYLMKQLKIKAGTMMDKDDFEDAQATILGTGAFDYVNYELSGTCEPYRLRFMCRRGPISQLGLSGRFDSEEIVSMLVNVGFGVHKLQGHSLDFTGKVGTNPYAKFVYSYINPKGMTLNALAGVRYTDRNMFSIGDNKFKINFLDVRQELYLSNIRWSKFFLKVGARNDYYHVSSMMAKQVTGDYDINQLSNDYISAFVDAIADSFDNSYIPTKGRSLKLSYEWVFGGFPRKFNNFHTFQFSGKWLLGGDIFAAMPSIDARYLLGSDVPVPYTNTIGGTMAGRYLDQQIPFMGIDNAAAMQTMLAVGGLDVRFKLFKNNYLSGVFNYAATFDDFKDINSWSSDVYDYFGCGLQYVYNSIIGPVKGNIHWSSYNRRVGAYLSVGFDF